MSRRLLQTVNASIAIMTVALAAMTFFAGVKSPVYAGSDIPETSVLDSNLRFFGGIGAGIGLLLLWITPRIEQKTSWFRGLWLCAFLGGIGRAISMFTVGLPSTPLIVFTVIEVPLVPVLI